MDDIFQSFLRLRKTIFFGKVFKLIYPESLIIEDDNEQSNLPDSRS
jgi:hypothetical protein